MMIVTSEYGPIPLQWIGSYEMSLRDAQTADRGALFRVTSEAFGLAKPSQDLLLAPRSHILFRHSKCRALFGVDKAFAPVRAFEDGVSAHKRGDFVEALRIFKPLAEQGEVGCIDTGAAIE